MQTIDYIDLLNSSAQICGLELDNVSGDEFVRFRTAHNFRLQMIWQHYFWPDLRRVEKRYFRLEYSAASTYTATQEVFFPATQKYYQALTSVPINQAPATGSPLTTNLTYWTESAESYSASNYDNSKAYVQGDMVFYPDTDRFYQLHAASSTGNLPTDTTRWGVLTEFDRYVAYAQSGKTVLDTPHVLGVFDKNPHIHADAQKLTSFLSNNGVQVIEDKTAVYIDLRIREPQLKGNAWTSSTAYSVGQQVYYPDDDTVTATRGNFYECISATSIGESPDTQPAKWSKIEIPLEFGIYLKHAGAADFLDGEKEFARAKTQNDLADEELARLVFRYEAQQEQRQRTQVMTR